MNTTVLYKKMFTDYPDVLSVSEVSKILGVSSKTIYRLLRENKIGHIRIGKTYKIPKITLIKYLIN